MEWIPVIGLEVHARLRTRTKLFCSCETSFGAAPNTLCCPICLGYPGSLPVMNRHAVDLALAAALATGCTIRQSSRFARKNYFYPDLPKGYQITQYDEPLASGGQLEIAAGESSRTIRILRIHLEEDAGKLLHELPGKEMPPRSSLVDLNRAGTPLIEIVSEPDLASAEEAAEYASMLRRLLMHTNVCDGNMEEGSFRIDANISVHREGEPLGTRSEIKNLNSFRFLSRAIEFEIERQTRLAEKGEPVVQETRLYDALARETRPMRSKEEAHDYRYFPEPDLHPLAVDQAWIETIRGELPELPAARAKRYVAAGVPPREAEVLAADPAVAGYFDAVVAAGAPAVKASNWVRNEVLRAARERGIDPASSPLTPARLAALIGLLDQGRISAGAGKTVFEAMAESEEEPEAIVQRLGLEQISDPAAVRLAAEQVLADSPEQLAGYRAGKTQLLGF
ncbi:MAG: Asp-tRNA(Asn)/Glu-tRNA(Gln) amidotransferase subunit GatB, partial [Thermoanaerobaculia bacterium]